jgi:hypothetical protein
MARSWRDYETGIPTCDKTDNRDKTAVEALRHGGFVRNVSSVTALPSDISSGLATLRSMAAPRLHDPDRWSGVVSDALRLARDGWASKALALGWTDLDLFGAVPDRDGDPAGDGLAVWLAGRKLLALTAVYAVVDDGNGGRAFFNKREAEGAVLLWSLGNPRTGRS